jgi:hypothetical protein
MNLARRLPRPPAVRRNVLALGLAAIAVPATILLLSASGSTATPNSNYAGYPVLNSNEPPGLEFVSSHSAQSSSSSSSRPTWPLQAPEGAQGGWPMAESIRPLATEAPNTTAWIAKSLGGGVCVLLWAHQPSGDTPSIGYSCSEGSEEGLRRGASTEVSEIPGEPGRVDVAGVVPSTVSAVSVTLADGSSRTVPVKDGGWALEAEGAPQGYQSIAMGG